MFEKLAFVRNNPLGHEVPLLWKQEWRKCHTLPILSTLLLLLVSSSSSSSSLYLHIHALCCTRQTHQGVEPPQISAWEWIKKVCLLNTTELTWRHKKGMTLVGSRDYQGKENKPNSLRGANLASGTHVKV